MAVNPTHNPFAPGAGTSPPELAGRQLLLDEIRIALERVKLGRPARGKLMLGLRGVGKTVLLNRVQEIAELAGYQVIFVEAPEDRKLAELLVPRLRSILLKLSRLEGARDKARRALAVLRAFAAAFKVAVGDIEVGVNPELGTADSGDLDADLPDLMQVVGDAAKAAATPLAILIDEVQYLDRVDLSALIVAIHRVQQRALPILLFGAGLPQLAMLAGEAKSYAERLFDYPEIGALDAQAAREAIEVPIVREGARINGDALSAIVQSTSGYPYFLQEWGSHAWTAAAQSPITLKDVKSATAAALKQLDQGFFRVRLDRLTPREKDYVRAMAELGPGLHRSGEIASLLGIDVTVAGPLRNGLIKKGMVYSPQHGDTAFTVPMFDAFLRRTVPDWTPPAAVRKRKPKKR